MSNTQQRGESRKQQQAREIARRQERRQNLSRKQEWLASHVEIVVRYDA